MNEHANRGMISPVNLPVRAMMVAPLALMIGIWQVAPAWATIDNTVTVTGSSPGNTDDVTNTDTENVDVVDAAPALTVTKVADDDTDVAVGQTVTYTYTVTNSGNVTMTNVSLADVHDGAGTAPTPVFSGTPLTDTGTIGDSTDDGLDNIWDTLAPGDTVNFTSTYTVVQADLDSNGGGDGDIDNTATATGTYGGSPTTGQISYSIDLEDVTASLTVAKVADDTTDVTVGQVITYTYTVTNTGNVAITNVFLSDSHNGSGPAPVPGSEALLADNGTTGDSTDGGVDGNWDTLGPQDVITFTSTYTVTQSDVDNLQ
ncbi:MAG: hypothetical protein R3D45_15145 [Rhizobiaceae bacterium]